eukprot:6401551-Prymnesium_polylepis.3
MERANVAVDALSRKLDAVVRAAVGDDVTHRSGGEDRDPPRLDADERDGHRHVELVAADRAQEGLRQVPRGGHRRTLVDGHEPYHGLAHRHERWRLQLGFLCGRHGELSQRVAVGRRHQSRDLKECARDMM